MTQATSLRKTSEKTHNSLYAVMREKKTIEYYSLIYSKNTLFLWEHMLTENNIIKSRKVTWLRKWRAQLMLDALISLFSERNKKNEKKRKSNDIGVVEFDENTNKLLLTLENILLNSPKNSLRVAYLSPFEASRIYVLMKIISHSMTMQQATPWVKTIISLPDEEIWFWAWKIRQIGMNAVSALKTMYRNRLSSL